MSPLKVTIMLAASFLFFLGASLFQVSGTEQAIFSNLLSGIQVTPIMILQQVHDFLSGKLDFYNGIAFAGGFGVQFVLLTAAFPAAAAYAILHNRYSPVTSGEMSEGAYRIARAQHTVTKLIIAADMLTDVLYVTQHDTFLSQGHRVFSFILWFIPWPNLDGPNAGILVIGILYAGLLCFVNVVSVRMFVAHLEVLFLKVRGLA